MLNDEKVAVMNIRDRLVLSAQPGKIALIREGLFLRCYQQSLFSLLRLQQDVKVLGRQFKNLEGQWVFYAGFPASQITKRLPDAWEMAWGFEACCDDAEHQGYDDWLVAMTGDFEVRKKSSNTVSTQKGG